MKLLARLRFYCDGGNQHDCAKYKKPESGFHGTTCVHNEGIPFTSLRICTNKEVHKQVIQDLLNYAPGPNNG